MTTRTIVLLAAWFLGGEALHAQDPAKVLQRVPATANVVSSIDISGLMQSDLGTAEGWAQKRNMDYYAGRVAFPPTAKYIVSAAEFNPLERRCAWQIALMTFGDKVDPYVVAKKEGSEVSWIEQLAVIPSRRNAYFVEFDRWNYGSYVPANRQQFTRWVQFAKQSKSAGVSPYLVETLQKGGTFGQITIAMDLAHFIEKAEVLERLKGSKTFAESKADPAAWAGLISEMKGLRLSLRATQGFTAELQFDFNEKTKPYEELFPALVNEVAHRVGVGLGDVSGWRCEAVNNSMVLRGTVSSEDVRRVVGLMLPLSPNAEADESTGSGGQAVVSVSQRHFRAVDNLLKELRAKSDQLGSKRQWQTMASWYEYTAAKLDQLPNVNADPELIKYTGATADRIRIMAESLRGVNVQDKVLDSYKRSGYDYGAAWGGYYGGGTGWGGGGYWDNSKDVESAKAEAAAKGAKDRNMLWRMICDDTTAIRQLLAKKYNAEF